MLPSTRVLAVRAAAPRDCFALCLLQLQFFTPRILLLHSFSLSQDSRISKALLVLSLTEIFVKHIPTIFKCSFYCGVLWLSRCVKCVSDCSMMGSLCYYDFNYVSWKRQSLKKVRGKKEEKEEEIGK